MTSKTQNNEDAAISGLCQVLPDASMLLVRDTEPVGALLPNADIVFDTNALLVPYRSGKDSLGKIAQLLEKLKQEKRLFLPSQVLREFTKVRPVTLGEVFKSLADLNSTIKAPGNVSFPLLEGLPEYSKLREAEQGLHASLETFKASLRDLMKVTQEAWGLSDPVFDCYLKIFNGDHIIGHDYEDAEVAAIAKRRYDAQIPPGYKDASKSDGGVGDLQIWLSILKLGDARKKNVVFVTGEEKADWFHRGNSRGIMPRVELLDEYRRFSRASFRIAPLSLLIEQLLPSVSVQTLNSVKNAEEVDRRLESMKCPHCGADVLWSIRLGHGATAKPRCGQCAESFHAHRQRDSIVVRIPHGKRMAAVDEMERWFFENYMDPAEGVPFDSAEGGYVYAGGEPLTTLTILADQYGTRFPRPWLEEVANAIEADHADLWVRRSDYEEA